MCDWIEANAGEPFEGVHGPEGHDHDGADEECGHDHEDCAGTTGTALFFPASEALYIETGPNGMVRLSAKTSVLGPGYHRWLCALLQDLGREFDVEWKEADDEGDPGDDTGYFFHGDPVRVDQEMRLWLKAGCTMLGGYLKEGYTGLGLSMPADPQFVDFGPVLTVLGPRSADWLDRTAANPAQGTDIFPWWDEGVGATFFRNRALCRMWESVCWREPIDDDEMSLLQSIHSDLSESYRLDPSLSLPWREWNELLEFAESANEEPLDVTPQLRRTIREFAATHPAGDRIGYRRGRVRSQVAGGWSIEVPGSLLETIDDEGNWGTMDEDRQVWVSSLSLQREEGGPVPAEEILETVLEEAPGDIPFTAEEGIIGSARCSFENDAETPHWQLSGRCAVEGSVALTTILFTNESDRDWAISVWRSIRFQRPEE